jgi:hypothetical protein
MSARGRPVLGVLAGLVAGVALGVALLVFGVLALDSSVLVVLPIAGVVLGLVLGVSGPFGSRSAPRHP